jgi:hypothetical protein
MLQNLDILAGHQIPGLIDAGQIRRTLEAAYSFELDLDAVPE